VHDLIVRSILQDRRIAFAITDRHYTVLEVGDPEFSAHAEVAVEPGSNLLDAVPELVGCETALVELLSGTLLRFQLPWVNREQPDGSLLYLTFIVLPYYGAAGEIAGLLLVVHDVT